MNDLTKNILRARDEWMLWLLEKELGKYPTSEPVAALYRRRLAGDEPSQGEWAAADAAADAAAAAAAAARAADAAAAAAAAAARAAAYAAAAAADADAAADAAAYAAAADAAAEAEAGQRIAQALLDALRRNGVEPATPALHSLVLTGVQEKGIDMSTWHCGTTHCRAGWAITVAPLGLQLEKHLGPELAGRVVYLASTGYSPDFFCSNEEAFEDIKRCAAAGDL
jgi:hypothetical protein